MCFCVCGDDEIRSLLFLETHKMDDIMFYLDIYYWVVGCARFDSGKKNQH